jgi:hypothetical protein
MHFSASEVGFSEGLCGASNAQGIGPSHYVLFGLQQDDQHPDNSGVYFEYDDQINGSVNGVDQVVLSDKKVKFLLADGTSILVQCGVKEQEWAIFIGGIESVFEPGKITRQ